MFNLVKWKKQKILNKFKIRDKRRDRIIEEGDCSVKHAFTPKDLAKAAIRRNLDTKYKCLRCKEWISYGSMLNFVMKKEGIDPKDKQALFDSYNSEWYKKPTKDNESKKDNKK